MIFVPPLPLIKETHRGNGCLTFPPKLADAERPWSTRRSSLTRRSAVRPRSLARVSLEYVLEFLETDTRLLCWLLGKRCRNRTSYFVCIMERRHEEGDLRVLTEGKIAIVFWAGAWGTLISYSSLSFLVFCLQARRNLLRGRRNRCVHLKYGSIRSKRQKH